jgi:hypothetical protein
MMMRMLAAGGIAVQSDERRSADDDNPLGYFEDERVKDLGRDASWIEEARGKAVKVVSALLKHLPPGHRYKIIFMRRDVDEVLASQSTMLTRRGKSASSADDARMRVLFTKHLDSISAELAGRGDTDVLYVEYRAVVSDPQAEAARVSAFLGGGLDTAAMVAAVDPALYRQRR